MYTPTNMALELDSLQRPLHKLRKSLKDFPKEPPAEDVHRLRTQARRLEAMAAALMFGENGHARRMLKTVAALRKAAGEVRDMDVHINHARELAKGDIRDDDRACLERLAHHLCAIRVQSAGVLYAKVAEARKAARHGLKQYSRQVERNFEGGRPNASRARAQAGTPPRVDPAAVALDFASELSQWPRLHTGNLHRFRIKVKKLRYVVELVEDADQNLVNALQEVKDRIGEWHDWNELGKIAREVLDHRGDCSVRGKVQEIEKVKLNEALTSANAMRKQYLGPEAMDPKGRKGPSAQLNGWTTRSVA